MMELSNWSALIPFLRWIGALSLVTFLVSLAIIPWLVGKLPRDFFIRHPGPAKHLNPSSGLFALLWFVLRNLAGAILLIAGIAMLFLPGQGILTIIVGLSLMSFRGKRRLLRILTVQPSIQRGLDWMRSKTGSPAFIWPPRYRVNPPATNR